MEFQSFSRLLQLILDGVNNEEMSSIDANETEETSVLLANYPFPITKGCYLAIEKEYGTPIMKEQRNTVTEIIHIIIVVHSIYFNV